MIEYVWQEYISYDLDAATATNASEEVVNLNVKLSSLGRAKVIANGIKHATRRGEVVSGNPPTQSSLVNPDVVISHMENKGSKHQVMIGSCAPTCEA